MKRGPAIAAALVVMLGFVATQVTLFVVPPIGALPQGKTVLMTRLSNMEFIDSPDAMCERLQGGVSLICRGIAIAAVMQRAKILLRLPYSSLLYSISTRGKTYEH